MSLLPEDSNTLRCEVIATALAMNAAGLNVNTSGNVSARCTRGNRAGFLITPTRMPYYQLVSDDIVFMQLADGACFGQRLPSSEWRFHRDIYAHRPDVAAIVHCHSPHATALACHGRGIPAFHYMVAVAGGSDVRCAHYATFGTQALSDAALTALHDRKACLLSHHGLIAAEGSLERALALAIEVENLARTYQLACALGPPPLLSGEAMAEVLEKISAYGHHHP